MTCQIHGVGGGGGRIATEFWKGTNIGLRGAWIDFDDKEPKDKGIGNLKEKKRTGCYIIAREDDIKKKIKEAMWETDGSLDLGRGTDRRSEVSMAVFLEPEVATAKLSKLGEEIIEDMVKKEAFDREECPFILFTVALGGGTGTGIVNPISEKLHTGKDISTFVLATLTGKKDEKQSSRPLHRRYFNTAWTLWHILSEDKSKGVDAVFLVDNEVLTEKAGTDDPRKSNNLIFETFLPMINPMKIDDGFERNELANKISGAYTNKPSIIVPCYAKEEDAGKGKEENSENLLDELLNKALENGCLMKCDYEKAKGIVVFTSILDLTVDDIKKKIEGEWRKKGKKISEIYVCRVLSHENEILVLLRDPYGGEDPFYNRFFDSTINGKTFPGIIDEAIRYSKDKMENDILKGFSQKYTIYLKGRVGELIDGCDKMKEMIKGGNKPVFEERA